MDEFDIYWMEWRDNNEIALGINGKENVRMRTDGSYTGIANGTASWNSSYTVGRLRTNTIRKGYIYY